MPTLVVFCALVYLGLGALFAVPFAWRGARALDDAASGGSLGFRFFILPGAAALWPVLALKWASASRGSRR